MKGLLTLACAQPATVARKEAHQRCLRPHRPLHIHCELQAGMTSINDFATTYMCQSLPFGGVKHSGFDRFAGIEGLRGMCIPKVGRRAAGVAAAGGRRWAGARARLIGRSLHIPPLLRSGSHQD